MEIKYIDCMVCGKEIDLKNEEFGEYVVCPHCGSILNYTIDIDVVMEAGDYGE